MFHPWKYLSEKQVADMEDCFDKDELKKILKQNFKIVYGDERKTAVAVDYHFHNYAFCKQRGFNALKISTFLSIANEIFLRDAREPSFTRTTSFEYFRNELFRHSIQKPPKSIKVFEDEEMETILNYFINSYYRHFQLYKYMFSSINRVVLKQCCMNEVERPRMKMLPLGEGLQLLPIPPPNE